MLFQRVAPRVVTVSMVDLLSWRVGVVERAFVVDEGRPARKAPRVFITRGTFLLR